MRSVSRISVVLVVLVAFVGVAAGSAGAFSAPPGDTFTATDCDGHGGVADAILNEERQIGDGVWVVSGVRCVDGSEFLYDQVYVGPASPPVQPADSGLVFVSDSQLADGGSDGGCIPDDTDWMNGGCG